MDFVPARAGDRSQVERLTSDVIRLVQGEVSS
jgi:hypothetical protein